MPHPLDTKYIPGDHWVVCDVCGFECRASVAQERWDGYLVCPEDYEERHPQDYLRVRKDDPSAKGNVRTEPADEFVTGVCTTSTSVAGDAVAGCMVAGKTDALPAGTFSGSGL